MSATVSEFTIRGGGESSDAFRDVLSAWMDKFDISQAEVARRSNMSRQIISKYLDKEDAHSPALKHLPSLARAFGVSVIQFLIGPDVDISQDGDYNLDQLGSLAGNGQDSQGPGIGEVVMLPVLDEFPSSRESSLHLMEEARGTFPVMQKVVTNMPSGVLTVETSSMYPDIMPGDKVLINSARRRPRSTDVIAAVLNGKKVIRRLRIKDGVTSLTARNPDYPTITVSDDDELVFVGIVECVVHRSLAEVSE